ncbi:phosphatase PAP2 family protein [Alicyclobacillus sp. TC]|uniref:phosphatase PAP2 family protein n=1 Tax=Alicyclobacillus sp. TC TaxID=2606450 RepID=UPI0019341CBC|nr:phosphatase PAP2 family protein [Alicyclobacillus sp. TC]QRF23982.1 phosphatase PAP2 family protein [Alicyclobacillus sp. TC]
MPVAKWLSDKVGRIAWIDGWMKVTAKWNPMLILFIIFLLNMGFGLSNRPWFHHSLLSLDLVAILSAVLGRFLNHPISHWISRKRPFEEQYMRSLLDHDPGESFPSNHATGAFALVIPFIFVPGYALVLLVLAILLAFSRIYCGLHYVSDVWAGALTGMGLSFIGLFVLSLLPSTTIMQ